MLLVREFVIEVLYFFVSFIVEYVILTLANSSN